jgi:hypothetical protein
MATKKRASNRKTAEAFPKLTDTEQDLLWHMEHGYELETDSLGSDPVLRQLRNGEAIWPPSANRNTIKSMVAT